MSQRQPSAAASPLPGTATAAPPAVPPQAPHCVVSSEPGTSGDLCMSRDAEPWDRRHHVPEDENAYGLRRTDDEAAAHDTRHEGQAPLPP